MRLKLAIWVSMLEGPGGRMAMLDGGVFGPAGQRRPIRWDAARRKPFMCR